MRGDDVLVLLCGDILLRPPPRRQPPIVRAGATVGLELLDLLLNPEHLLRVTEELTLRTSLVLTRRVTIDISLDRMGRHQEEGAAQLSALISDRGDLEADNPGEEFLRGAQAAATGNAAAGPPRRRLWVPLDTVPQPLPVPVEVTTVDGTVLPRPTQHDVKQALDAALYQILRESLRAHPDFERDATPINLVMRSDHLALWMVQSTLLAIASIAPRAAHWDLCAAEVRRRLDGVDLAAVGGDERRQALTTLAAGPGLAPSRRRALQAVRDAFADDDPFLDLVALVHWNYFVVAGLDPSMREQSVRYDLPESDPLGTSVAAHPAMNFRRGFDPREHNYTVHVRVPLPDNVRQYSLPVAASSADGADSHTEVSLIGAVHFDDHPGRPAIDTILTCVQELEDSLGADDRGQPAGVVARAMEVGFVARQAMAAVHRLGAIVNEQADAADEWEDRWGRASTWTVRQSIDKVRTVAQAASDQLERARQELQKTVVAADGRRVTPGRLRRASAALRDATDAVDHDLLRTVLVSNELAGQATARIRLGRQTMQKRSGVRPRMLEVWATISDEALPFVQGAVVPPVGLAAFIYVTGCLLFDTWKWMWPAHLLSLPHETTLTGGTDAIVAVLLLIPAFAVTQISVPDRWSVAGRLRRTTRRFVQVAIVSLGTLSMVVATQVGASTPSGGSGHPHLVLWTFRGALGFFVLWSLWAFAAWGFRHKHVWRPKGLKSYIGSEALVHAGPPNRRAQRLRAWVGRRFGWMVRLVRFFRFDSKGPDVEFDLSYPTPSFPFRFGPSRGRSPKEVP